MGPVIHSTETNSEKLSVHSTLHRPNNKLLCWGVADIKAMLNQLIWESQEDTDPFVMPVFVDNTNYHYGLVAWWSNAGYVTERHDDAGHIFNSDGVVAMSLG